MSEWITPIFDRTEADVSTAKNNQGNTVANKGAVNYTDLNRIEGNYKYLIDRLSENTIAVPHEYRNYDWQEENLPWLSEINRLRTNHDNLVGSYLVGMGFQNLAKEKSLGYEEVNTWEKMLNSGKTMIDNMEKEFIYCGTIDSGGQRLL